MNKNLNIKLMQIFLLIFSVLMLTKSYGQDTLVGSIVDNETKEKLAYVNIGVLNKAIGTVSSVKGDFSIIIPHGYDNDTLKISCIGYESFSMVVSEFRNKLDSATIIGLFSKIIEMEEFVVLGKELKTKVLGNKNPSKWFGGIGFPSNQLGREIGIKINPKRKPTYIKDFNINIFLNTYDTLKFRVNFYDIKNGVPNNRLFNKNIIVVTTIKEGKLTVDLSEYDIVIEDDFFITIEWIENLGPSDGLFFSKVFKKNALVSRSTSQAKWGTLEKGGIGIYVTALY